MNIEIGWILENEMYPIKNDELKIYFFQRVFKL